MLCKVVDEKFPLWAKIVLCIIGGAAGVYRIFCYVDDCVEYKQEKNYTALVCGIICLIFFPIGLIVGVIDLISIILTGHFAKFLR